MSLVSDVTGVDVNVGDSFSASNLWGSLVPGGDIQAPKSSTQEDAINQMIMDSLQSSNALSEALMPYMMAEMGYKYTSTPGVNGGKPTISVTEIPWEERLKGMTPQEQKQYQMQDKLIKQQFVSMGYNPGTLEQFKTIDEMKGFMSPVQIQEFELNQSKQRSAMIANGMNPDTGKTFQTEQEMKGFLSPIQQQEYNTSATLRKESLLANGINPETGKKFQTDEEMMGFMSPSQKQEYQINASQRRKNLVANGINPDTGQQMSETERFAALNDIQKAQYTLQKDTLDTQLKALRGELPVSPGLERDLAKGQELTGADLSQRLGPNWKQTTAGIQTMGKFEEGANIARDAARRGLMGNVTGVSGMDIFSQNQLNAGGYQPSASNLGLLGGLYKGSQQDTGYQPSTNNLGLLSGLYNQGVGTSMGQQGQRMAGLSGMPSYGQNWQGYQTAMQPYQYYSGLANQANMQNSANQATTTAGLYGMLGQAAGSAAAIFGMKK